MAARANTAAGIIAGAGHSGSTLLGLTLGSHPDVFYCGEAGKTRFLGDESKPLKKRVCKLCGPDCPVWGSFRVATDPDLYEQVARATGKPVVVDSTKDPAWIRDRLGELGEAGVPALLVFLRRDGRAVLGSRLRKRPDDSPEQLIRRWIERMHETRALYETHEGPKAVVRYEQLVRDPEPVVRGLCEQLGLHYDPAMLRYERFEHHPLGGNNGTQYLVARAQGLDGGLAQLSERRRDYYEAHPGGFRLDARWKDDLDPEVLSLFDRLAGPLNAELMQ